MKMIAITCAALALMLFGCTTTSVTMSLQAIEPVNLADGSSDSRVVEVRIYELKDKTKFEQAVTEDIWDKAEETLGGDLLSVKNADPVYPQKPNAAEGGTKVVIDPLNAETKFIGVLALMTNSDTVGKRHVVVTLEEADDVIFRITGYHIEIKR